MPASCGFPLSIGLLVALLGGCVCLAGGHPDETWPEQYTVELRLEPATHRISGISTIRVGGSSPVLRFLLNKDLTVTAVRAGTTALSFSSGALEREARVLLVTAAKDFAGGEITIEYEGTVTPPGPNDPDWMGALVVRGDEVRMTEQSKWFPMLEGTRAPVQTTIIMPSDLVLVGPVNARKLEGDSRTSRWQVSCSKPAGPALIAGAFEIMDLAGSNARVALFPDHADKAKVILETAEQIMSFLEARFGPAPFDVLTVCQMRVLNPRYSYNFAGPGLVVLPSEIIAMAGRPERRSFWTRKLAHEIAHQWWGCSVSLPQEPWTISESLAELAAVMYLESVEPEKGMHAFFGKEIEELQLGSFMARRGQRVDDRTFRKSLAYRKGPIVLGMLRELLGHERFDEVLRGFYGENAFGNATALEFRRAFGERHGLAMDEFFEQWLERRVLPKVRVEVVGKEPVALRVVQEEPVFSFPLEIEVGSELGRSSVNCMVTEAEQVVETGVNGRVDWVRVDPEGKVLMEMGDGVAEAWRYLIAATVEYDEMFRDDDLLGINVKAVKELRDVFRVYLRALSVGSGRERLAREGKIDLKTEFELQRFERLREGLEQVAGGKELGPLVREVEDAADEICDRIRDGRTEGVAENAERLRAEWKRFCGLVRMERFAE